MREGRGREEGREGSCSTYSTYTVVHTCIGRIEPFGVDISCDTIPPSYVVYETYHPSHDMSCDCNNPQVT